MDQQADGTFMVTYIPVETGFFDINVTWNGKELPGKIVLLLYGQANDILVLITSVSS